MFYFYTAATCANNWISDRNAEVRLRPQAFYQCELISFPTINAIRSKCRIKILKFGSGNQFTCFSLDPTIFCRPACTLFWRRTIRSGNDHLLFQFRLLNICGNSNWNSVLRCNLKKSRANNYYVTVDENDACSEKLFSAIVNYSLFLTSAWWSRSLTAYPIEITVIKSGIFSIQIKCCPILRNVNKSARQE